MFLYYLINIWKVKQNWLKKMLSHLAGLAHLCVFIWKIFISPRLALYWLSLSGCQNNNSLGINFDKIVISFFVLFKPPLLPDFKNNSAKIDLEKEIVIYFWYDKPRLNAFSGIWNLDRLQNKHKQKEPNFPKFPNFLTVQIRNKISKGITVNQRFYLIFEREFFNTGTVLTCFNVFCLTNTSYAKI